MIIIGSATSEHDFPAFYPKLAEILERVPPARIYAVWGLLTRPLWVRRNRTLSQTSPGTASTESPIRHAYTSHFVTLYALIQRSMEIRNDRAFETHTPT